MSQNIKDQQKILTKLGVEKLNAMQEESILAIESHNDVIVLSPTGTGKTIAFLLPIILNLDSECKNVQAMIIAPSRELAIQIEQVARKMGAGYKINAIYGGRHISKDKIELKHNPAIIIGTPGRIADHLRRKTFVTNNIKTLVLDEYDKSLEIGFEEEMEEIASLLNNVKKRILTSATKKIKIPAFIGLKNPISVDYSGDSVSKLKIKTIISPSKDKLNTLLDALLYIGNKPGIVFCNFKDSINRISEFLDQNNVAHACFYGGMEQQDRERALIKFRNGTHQLLLATDLAARGIDVPEIEFIMHYQLPYKEKEFTHRNGRTARMNSKGTAYILQWEDEFLPDFIDRIEEDISEKTRLRSSEWETLFISGGRKDKISKGDIAGLFMKQAGIEKSALGVIELKQDCAFVAVHKKNVKQIIDKLNNTKLKNKKVRINIVD